MFKVVLPSLVLLTSLAVFAEDAPKPEVKKADPVVQQADYNFVGLNLGISRPVNKNSDGIPPRFQYELEGIHALSRQFAVGAFISRNNGPVTDGSAVNISYIRIGGEAIYSPTYDSFIDLRAGLGLLKAEAKIGNFVATSETFKPFFVGVGGGLTVPVMNNFDFVPALHYTRFIKTTDVPSFDMFDVTAGVRMHF
jgi:hypothetical protein